MKRIIFIICIFAGHLSLAANECEQNFLELTPKIKIVTLSKKYYFKNIIFVVDGTQSKIKIKDPASNIDGSFKFYAEDKSEDKKILISLVKFIRSFEAGGKSKYETTPADATGRFALEDDRVIFLITDFERK